MENKSGIRPIAHRVLVLPEQVEEKAGAGMIIKPTELVDKEKLAQVEAIIVEQGEMAFSYGKMQSGAIDYWAGYLPKPGDKVMFSKYNGIVRKGKDGKEYRLITDKDILAVLEGE